MLWYSKVECNKESWLLERFWELKKVAYKQLMGLTERYKAVSIAVFAGMNINNPLTVESVVTSLMSYENEKSLTTHLKQLSIQFLC